MREGANSIIVSYPELSIMSPMSWFVGEYVYNLTSNEIEDSVHILLALISQRLFMYCGFNSHGFVYLN